MKPVRIDAAPANHGGALTVRDVHLSPAMRFVSRLPVGRTVVDWAIRRELRAEAVRSVGLDRSDDDRRARFAGIRSR